MISIKDAALEYLEWGLSIIPIISGGKKPLIKWEEYQHRHASESEVEEWFDKWPDANIALVTGQISKVAAIDLDSPDARLWARENLSGDHAPVMWQKTTKGSHLLYRANDTIIPNAVRIAPGVDIRGEGGYILIAPSFHPSGEKYVLHSELGDWQDLTAFPLEKLPKPTINEQGKINFSDVDSGERNNALARLAGRYFNREMSNEEVMMLCKGWNFSLTNPLPMKEVEATVGSIGKKHIQNHPLDQPIDLTEQQGSCVSNNKQDISNNKQGVSENKQMSAEINRNKQDVSNQSLNFAELSLTQIVENWVLENEGSFQTSQIDRDLALVTRKEKNNRAQVLNRLKKHGVIRKDGAKAGSWRIVSGDCESMNVMTDRVDKINLPLPLGLYDMVNLYPGSIIVVAGTSNSGKSAFATNLAFSVYAYISTLKRYSTINSIGAYISKQGKKSPETYAEYLAPTLDPRNDQIECHYFNSEMASCEMRDRLESYPGGVEAFEQVKFWKRSHDFADVIRPNALNIIDFLECYDEFWKIGHWINEVHTELNNGIAVIVLQKKHGAMVGRGGELTMEKPRLYISLESNAPHGGICKIVKAKSFNGGNPNGMEIDFKLADGWKFVPISDWRHVSENERVKINLGYKKQNSNDPSELLFTFETDTGDIVGINEKTLREWIDVYENVEVEFELSKIAKSSRNGKWLKKKSWFFQVSGMLKKKNSEQQTDASPF